MNKEMINKSIGYLGGFLVVVLFVLVLYTIWNFSFFLLKVNLSLLWSITVLYFLDSCTK